MLARGGVSEIVHEVLDALEERGLLDDSRFAETYIRQRAQRGFGPVRIAAELGERGVDPAEVVSALRDYSKDWCGLARTALRKKFGVAAPANRRREAQQIRFLAYRGFTHGQIRAALGGAEALIMDG